MSVDDQRQRNPVARLRWLLLPYIGFHCDDTELWRWWMRPARWLWLALGYLPGHHLFKPTPAVWCDCDECRAARLEYPA